MKLAILLPERPDAGWVWRAEALAAVLHEAAPMLGQDLEVVIGLSRATPQWNRCAQDLQSNKPWLSVRPLEWRPAPVDQFHRVYADIERIAFVDHYNIPRDGGWNYSDCDAWVVCADERIGAPPPLRPTAIYCRGLSSRYVVGTFGDIRTDAAWSSQMDAFLAWRKARCVFAVEDHTLGDVVSYAGVQRGKTLKIPTLWDRRTRTTPTRPSRLAPGYLAWLVEPDAAHDPLNALAGLADYVSRGGERPIALIGQGVAEFDLKAGPLNPYRQALASNVELLARTTVIPTPHAEALNQAVADAGVVWSSLLADGEPEAPRLAAQYGKWLLAVDFPQMRIASAPARSVFYDPFQLDALVDALFAADQSATHHPGAAPAEPVTSAAAAYTPILQSLAADAV